MRFLIAALLCFTVLTIGCSVGSEEGTTTATATIPNDASSAIAMEQSVANRVEQTSLKTSGGFSIDDITASDESADARENVNAGGVPMTNSAAADIADTSPSKTQDGHDDIPQAVKDLPTQKIRQNFPNGQQHKLFEAKVLPGQRVIYHGGYIEFYSNGNKQKAGRYDYAKKVGQWQFWSQAGVLRKQGAYQQDRQEGSWKKWREDGTLEWMELYRNGLADGKWTAFGGDGKTIVWERSYKAGQRHGLWVNYYPSGEKQSVETYVDGKLHGPAKTWHKNGQVEMEGAYVDGLRHGIFKAFGPNGSQLNQAEWTNGKL